MNIWFDEPLRCHAAGFLIGFREPLLLEKLDSPRNVTFDLLQCALALHDSGTALLTELLDLVGCYDHVFTLQLSDEVEPCDSVIGIAPNSAAAVQQFMRGLAQ